MAIELTKEKSEEVAMHIRMINIYCGMIDLEYLKALGTEMAQHAIKYDSAAVLNRSYTTEKSELKRKQWEALSELCQYIEASKEVSELKDKAAASDKQMDEISKMFE